MRGALRIAALLLGAALLLAAAAGVLVFSSRDTGVETAELTLPGGGRAVIYGGGMREGAEWTLTDEDGHSHTLTSSGTVSAALLLETRGERAAALATEMARRGVCVMAVPAGTGAAEAWDALLAQSFVRRSTVALIAGKGRAAEALALANELAGGGKEAAAVVLYGDEALIKEAAGSPARNILILTGSEPSRDAIEAFLGEREEHPGWIGGYFSEGTARRVFRSVRAKWDRTNALLPVIDWLGSSLGHAVEIPDTDLPSVALGRKQTAAEACGAAAAVLAAAALAVYGRDRIVRRKTHGDTQTERDSGGIPPKT